jgi:diguanylate cyclase (GGDEF)-like protein
LLENVRSTDCVARLGGDEFAILLPEIAYPAAMRVADKLCIVIRQRLARFPPVTVSLGVAWFSVADRPFSEILKTADSLMYEVKENGKGAVRIRRFDDARPAMAIDRPGTGSS